MPTPSTQLRLLALLLALAPACANTSKTPTATPEPAPAPATEPAPANEPVAEGEPAPEPAGPDNSALVAALDALDTAIAGCDGKLGTAQASACADAVSAAVAGLGEPIQASSMAAELGTNQEEIQSHAAKLVKSAKGGKKGDKDQHHHLEDVARIAKDIRAKL